MLRCCCEGFAAVYLTKERSGRAHLSTPHSMVGAATLCYLLLQLCAGMNLLFPGLVLRRVVPDVARVGRMHGMSGAVLLLLATATMLGGLTTDWFHDSVAAEWAWYVSLVCPVLIYCLTAVPVLMNSDKSKQAVA